MTLKEYNTCVDQFSDQLFRFIVKTIWSVNDAQDILQSSFEKLWISHERVNFEKSKSYLFTIAYNTMMDHYRKTNRVDYKETLPETIASDDYSKMELKELVDKALDQLNEIQRSLVLLRDVEGYAYDEIGEIVGLNESQVKVYLFRARKKLHEILSPFVAGTSLSY